MEVDEGHRDPVNESPDQVSTPPKKPKDNAPPGEQHTLQETRRRQPSKRTCAEHTNVKLQHWHPLQHYPSLRKNYAEPHQAIASLVSDHSARQPTRHKPSTASALAWQTAC
ncbi:hypothetical protein [Streptomyces rimosus]|uniref:hypothetical protein n=1 Tax=Streptomyces rimosus TaxID=1927 RepID=UPI0006B28F60|nr:hypothetical protein [Streptomyces rimosus]